MKKILAITLCISMFNLGLAYAFNGDACISCDDENMELITAMGFEVEQTEDGMIVTNTITGESHVINPQYNAGLCQAYSFCVWFTFWVAYGIFFIPCMIGKISACS